jgi:hypothetical protein
MTTTDRLSGVNSGLGRKAPVIAATTANITLSGEQTIDGIAIVDGNRVLVKDQTTGSENGIYVASTGAWTRATDFDGTNDATFGTGVVVASGTVSARAEYILTTTSFTIGTTSLTFTQGLTDSPGADTVSNTSLANMATQTVKARDTAGTGDPEDVALTDIIDWLGSTQGMVLYRGASSWAALAAGTSGYILTAAGAGANPAWAANSASVHTPPQGRLTLETAVPVSTSDQSGKTTVYYTPHIGTSVPIYNGTTFTMTTFAELSQLTTDNTKSPAVVANNSVYDVFVWSDSGTMRATRGPLWSSDTSRGTGAGTTELERVGGIYLNKVDITNGPAANRGTYVGTIRSDGSAQINDTVLLRYVWNAYHAVKRPMRAVDATNTWNYSTATWRQANAAATNQISYVVGLSNDAVEAKVVGHAVNSGATVRGVSVGIGVDSTSANTASLTGRVQVDNTATVMAIASYAGYPGIGKHTLAWLEKGNGTDTQTWSGDGGFSDAELQSGISGVVFG